jgi:hypothetical protein
MVKFWRIYIKYSDFIRIIKLAVNMVLRIFVTFKNWRNSVSLYYSITSILYMSLVIIFCRYLFNIIKRA